MVRHVEINHTFKHPFEKVISAYFQKYTCGKDSNVTSITVLQHKTDPETGEEYMLRRGECVNVLPGFFKKLCPFPAIQVEEEAWLNSKERRLRLHSYSLTWSKYASLEEFSTFKACENNPNWTSFEQRGSISVYGVGSFIGGMMESFGQSFLQRGANKGFNIMEDLIMTMSGRYTEA
ncbi:unnamed protein product [Pocillopora meandrina]|uniref:PRELI/MSF1 domain-containing protein n=1 Tax=Pocillopora meandrina TaxID=46732 RepID=A0AAU9XHQ7_9CNID|nr:unnamed protein product [Pocillopora meandrina]